MVDGKDASDEGAEVLASVRDGLQGECEECMDLPPVKHGRSREELVKASKEDKSLVTWKKLADREEKGYSWEKGLLMQTITNHLFESKMLVVVPKTFRRQILALAHDHLGHLGFRKAKNIIRKNFTWPNLNRDVIQYCRSCEMCQRCSRSPAGKAPLITRQVTTEPFEVMAFDLWAHFLWLRV